MWHFGVGTSRLTENSPSPEELKMLATHNPDFNRLLKHGCKVLCVSQDGENVSKLDFSNRAFCKPRMWAQYADNHRGVCLLFDKQVLQETLENEFGCEALFCGSVAYDDFHDVISPGWPAHMEAFMLSGDDITRDGLETVLRRHRDKYHDVFFFRKNKDWEHEAEYRWIIHGDSNNPEFIPIEKALRAILIGIDFPIERLSEIHEYCEHTDTSLSRIVWQNGMPLVQWFEANQLSSPEYKKVLEFYALIPDG